MTAKKTISFLAGITIAFGMMGQSGPIDPGDGPQDPGGMDDGWWFKKFKCPTNGQTAWRAGQCPRCVNNTGTVVDCETCCKRFTRPNSTAERLCCLACEPFTNNTC